MSHYLVYVRRSFVGARDADVSDEAQVDASVAMLPPGATHEVISDSSGHNSGRTADRDGLRELIRRIEARSCAGVAVYDISRLARNTKLLLSVHEAIERANIPLLIATMPGSRFDTASGRFLLTTVAAAAAYQADMDSERAKGIRQRLYEDGYHRGHAPYGYRSERRANRRVLVVDETQAAIVRRIFDALPTRSYEDIARDLRAEGAPAPAGSWTRYAVRELHLRAKVYLGMVTRGRRLDERPGRHEPIITPEQYRGALAGARARDGGGRRTVAGRAYLLSGLLECDCGRRMVGHAGRSHLYYMCRECGRPMVRAAALDETVLSAIAEFRVSRRLMAEMRDELQRRLSIPSDDVAERQRQRLSARLIALRKQHSWGDIDDGTYRREKAETEAMLAQVPDEDKLVAFDAHRATVLNVADALPNMTPQEKKDLVRLFVERVTLVGAITWTGPVAPFYARVAGVSPEGSSPAVQPLHWYVEKQA